LETVVPTGIPFVDGVAAVGGVLISQKRKLFRVIVVVKARNEFSQYERGGSKTDAFQYKLVVNGDVFDDTLAGEGVTSTLNALTVGKAIKRVSHV
jgi:hypothetical protein